MLMECTVLTYESLLLIILVYVLDSILLLLFVKRQHVF